MLRDPVRDAVLGGRRAEMIERVYGTEGGEILSIHRYDGHGRLIRHDHDQTDDGSCRVTDAWRRSEGATILGTIPLRWDFDPWLSAELTD